MKIQPEGKTHRRESEREAQYPVKESEKPEERLVGMLVLQIWWKYAYVVEKQRKLNSGMPLKP